MSDEVATPQEETEETAQQPAEPDRPRVKKRKIIPIIVVLLIAIGIFLYWRSTQGRISTDDAQIDGNLVPISARVGGYVKDLYVDNNDMVTAGELLVDLDPRDLATRLSQQEADLATQNAQASAAAGQEALTGVTAPSGAQQATAGVSAAQAAAQAAQDQITAAQEQFRSAQAGVSAAQGAVASAQADVEAANAQIQAAQATIKAAQADVTSAQAQATRTAADLARAQQLFNRGATSRQALDVAIATNTSAQEAVNAARERVANAQAGLTQAQARRNAAQSAVKQANARLTASEAAVGQAQAGISSARSAYSRAQAQVGQAQAAQSGANTAPQQISVAEAQRRAALARASQSAANVRGAQLQLSYTQIFAPVGGMVSQRSVQLGQYVQPGQQLMSVVPLDQIWVTANFKETQIGDMHPGQKATIKVDAYPGREFKGTVQGIGASTGAKSSLLPPENATGNFVKVVQRIPVRIQLDRLPQGVILRPGQNVTATVITGK